MSYPNNNKVDAIGAPWEKKNNAAEMYRIKLQESIAAKTAAVEKNEQKNGFGASIFTSAPTNNAANL